MPPLTLRSLLLRLLFLQSLAKEIFFKLYQGRVRREKSNRLTEDNKIK